MNGHVNGQYGGKKYYTHSGTTYVMFWNQANSRWEIGGSLGGTALAYSISGDGHTGDCPFPASWTTNGTSATGTTTTTTTTTPAPTTTTTTPAPTTTTTPDPGGGS